MKMVFTRRITFFGIVRDAQGVSLAGADVEVRPRRGGESTQPESDLRINTTSGADGTYRFSALLPFGKYQVDAGKPGYGWASEEYEFMDWRRGLEFRIDFALKGLPLMSGTVWAPSGQVLPSASVTLTIRRKTADGNQIDYSTKVTDELGRFSIPLEDEGEVSLDVAHPLYRTVTKTLGSSDRLRGGLAVDLTFEKLRDGGYFVGHIRGELGKPVKPKELVLAKAIDRLDDPERSVVVPVGTDGKFEVILERGVQYWITVSATGYARLSYRAVTSETISSLNFDLSTQKR